MELSLILITPTPLSQPLCVEQKQRKPVCPARRAGCADNQHLGKEAGLEKLKKIYEELEEAEYECK